MGSQKTVSAFPTKARGVKSKLVKKTVTKATKTRNPARGFGGRAK